MFYISALEQLAKELEEVKSGNCEITILLFHLLLPDTLARGCDKHSSFFSMLNTHEQLTYYVI